MSEIIQPEANQLIQFGTFRNPETVLKEAELVARAFAKYASKNGLYKQIGPSKHLLSEGWQTLAAMYRVTAGVAEDKYVEYNGAHGFECIAEAIYVPTGQRISTAHGMCLDTEDNWGLRPKYEYIAGKKTEVGRVATPLQQIRSMAQTRACSKVLSNLLKWVARMGGFAGTPAEEMEGRENEGEDAPQRQQPPQKANTNGLASEAQIKRLFALKNNAGITDDQLGIVLAHYGFLHTDSITRDKYNDFVNDMLKGSQK